MPFLNPALILIALTAGISMYAWSNRELMEKWIFSPYLVARRNEWYRFLTSGFLHADFVHLGFNLFAFYSFSPAVLSEFAGTYGVRGGIAAFLLLYIGGIIVSDIPTYFRHRDDPGYRSLGASGGVSSVLFASILFYPVAAGGGGIIIFPLPIPIQPFLFGFLYLAYSYYQGRRRGDNINHDAHFYGALFGVVVALVLVPQAGLAFISQVRLYLYNSL
ncbi:rhomboid family intramembrane serine protease [Hymenobacter sp. BT186]|uniref:Rhomboid family intramembrane serine protease n=1 Tax=Hymenobacter telluris TaxID=2816474 RepID=A0A939EYE3_9BACT|nr:rhomboid family intramembrane serine protease [Hymenobacter telluris]MBO0359733.1 rhomboid family intramembrane serine protease [Hymenobacter telluris]MBW3375760.1 rhomboid family intramembrane serine protease [Hymenobacter norwichensis]